MFFSGLRDKLDKAGYFPSMPGILFMYFYELRKVTILFFTVHLKGLCHDTGEKLVSVIDTCVKLTPLKVLCIMRISWIGVSDTAAKSWSPLSLSTPIICHWYGMGWHWTTKSRQLRRKNQSYSNICFTVMQNFLSTVSTNNRKTSTSGQNVQKAQELPNTGIRIR